MEFPFCHSPDECCPATYFASKRPEPRKAGTAQLEVADATEWCARGAADTPRKLAQELQDLELYSAQEVRGAAERAAHRDRDAREARKSDRATLDRAARADWEARALPELRKRSWHRGWLVGLARHQ